MGAIMDDGSVVPGFLQIGTTDTSPNENSMFGIMNDSSLRMGVVVAAYAPDNEQNTSKQLWQYDVVAAVNDGNEISIPQIYPRAVVASMFGGVADYVRWKPRIETASADQDSQTKGKVSNNSYVLLLCPNGDSRQSFIIGSIPHPNADPDPMGEPLGDLYYIAQYNGINVSIDTKGSFVLQRKGPTKIDGTPEKSDDEKVGAKISMTEDGNVTIENGKGDKINFNFSDRAIELVTDKNVTITSNSGKVITKSTGVQLGGDSEHLIKGDTYRKAEDQFFSDVNTFMTTLISGLGTVGGAFTVEVGAKAALTALVTSLMPSLKALPTFQAQSVTYLSLRNTTE